MKKLFKVLSVTIVVFTLFSCGTTKVISENNETSEIKAPETKLPVEENVESPAVEEVDDEEYLRSTNKLNDGQKVSKDQFAKDKSEILKIIEELETIMAEKDYESWVTYISEDSKQFYTIPRKINNRGKIVILNGLNDYFIDLFIPSRDKATINEIRYISSESVKAVEFTKPSKPNERPKIITYYNFVKENNKWYVELPTNIVIK